MTDPGSTPLPSDDSADEAVVPPVHHEHAIMNARLDDDAV